MKATGIDAGMVAKALLAKHAKDICIPQCKTGGSMYGAFRQLDLWAMKKSWAHPRTWGYEIKVSRSDFLRDEKWREYLPYCQEFYFAAPPGIIDPSELPAEAGLMVTSKNGTSVFTKKKAPARDVEIPEKLYRYILMWRCKIVKEQATREDFWRAWLEDKADRRFLGNSVSDKIQQIVKRRVGDVMAENDRLQKENATLESIKRVVENLGLNLDELVKGNRGFYFERDFKRTLRKIAGLVPEGLEGYISNTIDNLRAVQGIIKNEA